MAERFSDDFITWHHKTPIGVKVDEVFGMDSKSGKVWIELARQIYCELGEPRYRVISHYDSGAPYLEGYNGRISITHTTHFLAVASLPKTPEVNLEFFNPRAALGIDAEPLDRAQVIKVRDKFLSEKEQNFIPESDLKTNILAWTSKEALYKAALTPGLDFRNNIELIQLPKLECENSKFDESVLGEALIHLPVNGSMEIVPMKLYSYCSYDCCVTIAVSPKANRFGK